MKTRTMYMLTRDGKPVVIHYGSDRVPIYRLVGETAHSIYPFKTLRAVARHIKIATEQQHPKVFARYGYVVVEVPA